METIISLVIEFSNKVWNGSQDPWQDRVPGTLRIQKGCQPHKFSLSGQPGMEKTGGCYYEVPLLGYCGSAEVSSAPPALLLPRASAIFAGDIGGYRTSKVYLKASSSMRGMNYRSSQLLSSRQGLVLTSISQGRMTESTIKSQPKISIQNFLWFLLSFYRTLIIVYSRTGTISSLVN